MEFIYFVFVEARTATLNINGSQKGEAAKGMELLWQTEVVQPYLALLSECSNPETLEAAAGAIQNLAACYWQPSIDIRGAVRKEKGLPILVELLRMEVDRVVCAVATALRNLAMDTRNKELIGKYALKDLVSKLPTPSASGMPLEMGTSDDTIAAVLATLNEVVAKNPDFAKSLLEAGGMQRLTLVIKNRTRFSSRVVKFTSQVCVKCLLIMLTTLMIIILFIPLSCYIICGNIVNCAKFTRKLAGKSHTSWCQRPPTQLRLVQEAAPARCEVNMDKVTPT